MSRRALPDLLRAKPGKLAGMLPRTQVWSRAAIRTSAFFPGNVSACDHTVIAGLNHRWEPRDDWLNTPEILGNTSLTLGWDTLFDLNLELEKL